MATHAHHHHEHHGSNLADAAQAALTAELVRHFGPRAGRPEAYVDGEWTDRQWTRGCYNANCGPYVWTHFGEALARPIGVIHWASTDTATFWSAYMEGAVDAGERAARIHRAAWREQLQH